MRQRAGGGTDNPTSTARRTKNEDMANMDNHGQGDNLTSVPCGVCCRDLVTEPCSIQCDNDTCKRLFHPSCLGNQAPYDSEKWFCCKCRDTEDSPKSSDIDKEIVKLRKEADTKKAASTKRTQQSKEDIFIKKSAIGDQINEATQSNPPANEPKLIN
jgi:hypothetical protein